LRETRRARPDSTASRSAASAPRYARAFDREDRDDVGRRPLLSLLPLGQHQPTASTNGLQMQAFCEAAEGIRTLDLLHGKQ
jgi:hypothetical protein